MGSITDTPGWLRSLPLQCTLLPERRSLSRAHNIQPHQVNLQSSCPNQRPVSHTNGRRFFPRGLRSIRIEFLVGTPQPFDNINDPDPPAVTPVYAGVRVARDTRVTTVGSLAEVEVFAPSAKARKAVPRP